uniref:C2H2-type domain-containing protein n=1 Tax=Panagrolaimus sp. JU765 TaxID=591449 RepID=A0AC34RDK5_9BILA
MYLISRFGYYLHFSSDVKRSFQYLKAELTGAADVCDHWIDKRAGDAWPEEKLVRALDRSLSTLPNEKPDQYVALWYQQGEPVMGRIWNEGGKIAANFSWGGHEYRNNIGPFQILVELPESVRGVDYEWKDFKEAAKFGDKEWFPVHVNHYKGDISPGVLIVDGGKEILGKVDVRNERATYGRDGKEVVLLAGAVHPCKVLCRKAKPAAIQCSGHRLFPVRKHGVLDDEFSTINRYVDDCVRKFGGHNCLKCSEEYSAKKHLLNHVSAQHAEVVNCFGIVAKVAAGVVFVVKRKPIGNAMHMYTNDVMTMVVWHVGANELFNVINQAILAFNGQNVQSFITYMDGVYQQMNCHENLMFFVAIFWNNEFHIYKYDSTDFPRRSIVIDFDAVGRRQEIRHQMSALFNPMDSLPVTSHKCAASLLRAGMQIHNQNVDIVVWDTEGTFELKADEQVQQIIQEGYSLP